MAHDLKLDGTTGTEMIGPGALGRGRQPRHRRRADPGLVHRPRPPRSRHGDGHRRHRRRPRGHGHGRAAEPRLCERRHHRPQRHPEADWRGLRPSLEPAPGGTEHEITLHAVEAEVEVAPASPAGLDVRRGRRQRQGTPRMGGPVPRGNVGDLFTITLVNDGRSTTHRLPRQPRRLGRRDALHRPGESLVHQYRAEYAGAFMYHCGTAPALHHIGNGMYGAIIINPPNLPEVDREFVIVQSELYLGEQGQPGSLDKMVNEDFDAVVFNGYYNQYKFSPIRGRGRRAHPGVGHRRRPVRELRLHIVGTIFDTVEGGQLPPAAGRHQRWLAGARPAARPGRLRGVQLRRGGLLPDGDPQVRQRRQGRPRPCSRPATSRCRAAPPATRGCCRAATATSGGQLAGCRGGRGGERRPSLRPR